VYFRQTFGIDRWDAAANKQTGSRGLQSLELPNALDVLVFMKPVESARHYDDYVGPFWSVSFLKAVSFQKLSDSRPVSTVADAAERFEVVGTCTVHLCSEPSIRNTIPPYDHS
jgi:hypothetical protein